jgi:predicted GIY-YIG superfamily endonuclease
VLGSGFMKKKWTGEAILKEAKKYKSKSEWQYNSKASYNAAYNKGLLVNFSKHMKKPDMTRKWTREAVIKNAKQFKYITEWTKNFSGAVDTARTKGWMKEATAHMVRPAWKGLRIWTKEKILEDAKKFKHRVRWSEKSGGAYAAAMRMSILKIATNHMTRPNTKGVNLGRKSPNKWTNELLKNSASKYKSIKEWRVKEESAYATASMRGLLKELTKNMDRGKVESWTKKSALNSARKYKHIGDWNTKEGSAYHYALNNGFIDEATKHMTPLGNQYKRCLYSITVKGTKKIYVGLTGNADRRKRDHFKTKRFVDLSKKHGKSSIIFKQLTDYILVKDAIKLEIKLEHDFKKKGYEVLNKARPGVIGGTTVKWTKKNIIKSALKFKILKEWRKKDPGAYNAALKLNILKEASSHLKRLHFKDIWNNETILDNAKKFQTKGEWKQKFPGAVLASINLGIYKKVTKHMKILSPRGHWTREAILKNAKKFKTKGVWRKKFGGAYSAASDRGVFEEATKHMIDGRSK